MNKKFIRILSLILCLLLLLQQSGFAQMAGSTTLATSGQLDISGYLAGLRNVLIQDKFRPLHLRYLSYDTLNNNFKLLLDKGDLKDIKTPQVQETTQKLLEYFFVGVSLPNDSFWVNLRPDSPDNIIDPYLAQTDVGKILLEADLQLKKDTAKFTSPENPKGKEYWDKLYQKAGELFGYDNITIPTLTRPWIVPDEIIVREANDNAYIYKATLKVQLEQDHLKDSPVYNFDDPRLKELNEYSSQLIRELIIPELTKEINISKRYAPLRQVYYSLILSQWFKQKFVTKGGFYSSLIDRRNLNGITSKTDWSKTTYFKEYQRSFQKGEYNIQQPISTPFGQTIRSYFSGGIGFGVAQGRAGILATAMQKGLVQAATPGDVLAGNSHSLSVDVNKGGTPDNVGVDREAIKLAQIPKPHFGHSGNKADGAIIEAQKAIQGGNIAVAFSKVKEAIRLLREVDFDALDTSGFPVADMVNQTEVAIWVLAQLETQGITDKDVLELSRQLKLGVNGLELKQALGFRQKEKLTNGISNGSSPLEMPRRLTIDECRKRLIENLSAVKAEYPTTQQIIREGLGILQSEGLDAFERKGYPRIRTALDGIRIKVDAVRSLPATFGFTEPEIRQRLDAFLQEIAREFKVDKVIIAFHFSWRDDFNYSYGFTEQELATWYLHRSEMPIGDKDEVEASKDAEKLAKGAELLRQCGIATALYGHTDLSRWQNNNDAAIEILIGRSAQSANINGKLAGADNAALNAKLNACVDQGNASWLGIREFLQRHRYSDYERFMQYLRHNGGIDNFKVRLYPVLYDYVPHYVERIKAGDEKWRQHLEGWLNHLGNEAYTINAMDSWLQILEVGTDFQPRNITPYVHGRVELFREPATVKGLRFIADLATEDFIVDSCDLNLLGVVLDNIVQNAIKYTQEGSVTVSLSKKSLKPEYGGDKERECAVLEVTDTGIGIPKDEQSKIFGRGFRASNVGEIYGTGIGLDAVQYIVPHMHGDFEVESEVGKGTKFTVALPLYKAPPGDSQGLGTKSPSPFSNEPEKSMPDSVKTSSPATQQVISMRITDIPQQAGIGEKPYKLLRMAQAGLNVPPFFVIISDGSGRIALTDDVRHAFGALRKPVIVRSAHKDEGAKYAFSGVFDSYGGITTLEPTGTEILSEDQEEFWDTGYRPESLQSAYKLIVEGAAENYRVKKYLEAHQIIDFDPNQMNVVVMEQVDFDVFGMFLTSNQNNPDDVLIHYQLVDKSAPEKKPEREPSFFERPKEKGGVITYNKKTQELGQNDLDEQTRSTLKQFGEIAGQIEQMFGVQQIELGVANGKVYVFQSRDINLSRPADAPRLAHYETLSEELDAIGYGYYHLPILVVDSLDKTHRGFRESEEYRRLQDAYMSTPDTQEELRRDRWRELEQFITAERNKYREELLRFVNEHPEYILVIKYAKDVIGDSDHSSLRGGKKYDFLNQLTSKARVVIRGRNQRAIRHEDWDNVDLGGITVIPPEEGGDRKRYFISMFECAREPGIQRSDFVYRTPSRKRDNVTLQKADRIVTGDQLNVLSNIDGVFVWIGNPLTGTDPASGGTPGNDKSGGSPTTVNNPNRDTSSVSSLTSNSAAVKNPGGVDFRALPILTQPLTGINMPFSRSDNFRVDTEWNEIQNMVNAGIIPSGQRIKDYLQSCCKKKELNGEIGIVLNCIADILRIEEERVLVTNSGLKGILVALESSKSSQELEVALSNIKFLPQEPQTPQP